MVRLVNVPISFAVSNKLAWKAHHLYYTLALLVFLQFHTIYYLLTIRLCYRHGHV